MKPLVSSLASACERAGCRRRDQSGTILVLVAMLMFVFMGMAALTIDVGMGILARLTMQTASDGAALEGLRIRDVGMDDPGSTPAQRDLARRSAVRTLIGLIFDDDLAPGGDPLNFGAGSVVDLTGGSGESNGLQTVAPGTPPVYKPQLETNHLANAAHGDMVAGQFNPTIADPPPPANERFDGASSFVRDDFANALPASAPVADGFLVRLRRSRDQHGIENQAGVSSAGPAMPFLFARGSPMQGGDPSAGYSARHHGFNVRASAIASARRALAVGAADPLVGRDGVAPFAVTRGFWQSILLDDVPVAVTIQGDGSLSFAGSVVGQSALNINVIGQPVVAAAPVAAPLPQRLYLPVYDVIAGVERVVGFGFVNGTGTVPGAVTLTRRPSRVAATNASANFLAAAALLDEPAWTLIFQANAALTSPLLAAALVR